MEIADVEEFAKQNVGRKVRWCIECESGEGKIVGYKKVGGWSRVVVDNYTYRAPANGDTVFLVDIDRTAWDKDQNRGGFAWLEPKWIKEFVNDEPKVAAKDPDFPHECPRCHGPAYVGFNVTVECKAKCPT